MSLKKSFQILIGIIIFCSLYTKGKDPRKESKRKKTFPKRKPNKALDDILSLYEWAKKTNIYINPNLKLNKNKENDLNHNFYFFTSNTTIENNTLLLKIPSKTIISQKSFDKYTKKSKNKKFISLWNNISTITNKKYIKDYWEKELLYITILICDSTLRQKGNIYKKYKEYFQMYDYINLDHHPILYSEKEVLYLNSSHFGKELDKNFNLINQEYSVIKYNLSLTNHVLIDDYIKYRILAIANSITYKNRTLIIPFIDCFNKKINQTHINSFYEFKENKEGDYDLEIYSNKTISTNKEIFLAWKKMPNSKTLLYYGFIDENNTFSPKFQVLMLNENFRKDLNVEMINQKYKINIDDLMKQNSYELNVEFFYGHVIDTYKNISVYFEKYNHDEDGAFQMMRDNLVYYLDMYNSKFSNELINRYISGTNKRKYIKNILEMEKRLVEKRIKNLDDLILEGTKNNEDKEVLELFRQYDKNMRN